jgi:nitrogen regulatory protein P-II 1
MKLVTAIIRPACLEAVERALAEYSIRETLISYVGDSGSQAGSHLIYRGAMMKDRQASSIKLEVAVDDPFVDPAVEAIQACADRHQDIRCVIYVQPLERMVCRGEGAAATGVGCLRYNKKQNVISPKQWMASALVALFTLGVLCAARADAVKPSDEGKAVEFKGKTFKLNAKGEAAILLSCTAGKEVTATTDGEKQTVVYLFIYDKNKKEVGKDTSPGPKCEVKFTPAEDGKFKLLVRNLGPGDNKVTIQVKVVE